MMPKMRIGQAFPLSPETALTCWGSPQESNGQAAAVSQPGSGCVTKVDRMVDLVVGVGRCG